MPKKLPANTSDAYTPGASYVRLYGAQSLTGSDTRGALSILADDGAYHEESEFQSGELQITVAGMALADLAALSGASITSGEGAVMTEGALDSAPEVALSFSGLLAGGEGYRLYQYFACRLTGWKADLSTRGKNNDIASVTLTFRYQGRAYDKKYRALSDVGASATLTTFLNGIAALTAG